MSEGAARVPHVNHQMLRHLQDTNTLVSFSSDFKKLPSNESRVTSVYNLMEGCGMLPVVMQDGKSNHRSDEMREMGNYAYKTKNARVSHEFYTKSLVYAEIGTDNVSLAYANRSAVLFENGLYRECLKDIEMALKNNYPERLIPKLVVRKRKAQNLVSKQEPVDYLTPVPSIPPQDQNPLIQSASNSVRIEHSPTMGRHVVATKTIEPGEIIAIEKSFCHVLIDQLYTHCHHCLKLCYTLFPCCNCTQALFCSETCQNEANSAYHQYECPILLTILSLELEHRLMHLRLTILVRDWYSKLDQCKIKQGEIYRSDRYEEIRNLEANTAKRSVSDLFNRSVHCAALYHVLSSATSFFKERDEQFEKGFKELLLFHMQAGPCNFHEIAELKSSDGCVAKKEIGAAALPFLSMFNHSCCPNITRYGYGTTVIAVAIERINAGDQCFDNYGSHHAITAKSERKDKLRKQYLFDCACIACVNNYPLYQNLEKLYNAEYGLTWRELEMMQSGGLVSAKKVLKEMVRKINMVCEFKPNKTLGELQEVLKQCLFIFETIKTPI
ncbi:SET and MYND domain-containing protein 4-like [Euwallacea fornicatus]|uniref:SET and MYND domain-containing protein 4-like n=1 Tax=Euwallacea fornicatus TaxID=995702 RepID=UPI00338F4CEC